MLKSSTRIDSSTLPSQGFHIWGPFGRAATLTSASALAGILIEFTSLCIAVRLLPKADVGAFAIFLVIGRIAQLIADCGVRQALVQMLAAAPNDHRETFHSALALQTITSTAVAATIVLASRWFNITPFQVAHYTSYLALYVLLQAWHQVMSGTLQGLRLYRAFAVGELSRSISRLAMICLLLLQFGRGLDGLLLATVLAPAFASIVQLVLLPLRIAPFALNRNRAQQLLMLAFPLGASNLLGIASDRVSRVILVATHGPVAVAMLEIASKATDASIQCFMGFQSAFFPTITTLLTYVDRRRASRALNDIVQLVAVALTLVSLVVTMERDIIIKTLFSSAYVETSWVFALLFSALTIALTNNLLHTTIIASGDTKVAFGLSAFQAVVSAGLCLGLIPRFGYLGAVYAFIASNCAVNPLLVYRLIRLDVDVRIASYVIPCSVIALIDALSVNHRTAAWLVCTIWTCVVLILIGRHVWWTALLSPLEAVREQCLSDDARVLLHRSNRLNVLVVTERYPPNHDGGYEIACKRTVDCLRSHGHSVTVLTSGDSRARQVPIGNVFRLLHRRMPQPGASLAPHYIIKELVRAAYLRINQAIARQMCRTVNPDVVFAWQTDGIGIGTVTTLQFRDCPIVHRLDDVTLASLLERLNQERNCLWRWARYFVYGIQSEALIFRHMVAVSSFLERRYVTAGIPPEAITVIHNGIPEECLISQVRGVCQGPKIRLLMAGRVCFDKGVHVAVNAVAELRDSVREEVILDLVGPVAASYTRTLEGLIIKLGLEDRVRICGQVSPNSMLQLYDAYDIVLFPSLVWEGFGLTLIEAMARGKPVVAVNRGGPRDIIADGINGLLVPPNDPIAIARAVRLLIRDQALRTRIQYDAIASIRQRFTMAKTEDRLEKYLCDVHASKKRVVQAAC